MANTVTYINSCTNSSYSKNPHVYFPWTSNYTYCRIESIELIRKDKILTIKPTLFIHDASETGLGTGTGRQRNAYLYTGCVLNSTTATATPGTLQSSGYQIKSSSVKWGGNQNHTVTPSFTIEVGNNAGTLKNCGIFIGPNTTWTSISSTNSLWFNGRYSSDIKSNHNSNCPRMILFNISYDATWTNVTAPTSVKVSSAYTKVGDNVAVSWSGAKAGILNDISSYTVFDNGTAVATINSAYLKTNIKISDTKSHKFTVRTNGVKADGALSTANATTTGYTSLLNSSGEGLEEVNINAPNNGFIRANTNFTFTWNKPADRVNNKISHYKFDDVDNIKGLSYSTESPNAGASKNLRIRIFTERGESYLSNIKTVYGVGVTAPTPTFSPNVFTDTIKISWNAATKLPNNNSLKVKYTLQYYTSKNGEYRNIATDLTTTSYTWTPNTSQITYGQNAYFRIVAYIYYGDTLIDRDIGVRSTNSISKMKLPNAAKKITITNNNIIDKFQGANTAISSISYTSGLNNITIPSGNNFRFSNNVTINVQLGVLVGSGYIRGARFSLKYRTTSGIDQLVWTKDVYETNDNGIATFKITSNDVKNFTSSCIVTLEFKSIHKYSGMVVEYSNTPDIKVKVPFMSEVSFDTNNHNFIIEPTNATYNVNFHENTSTIVNITNIGVIGVISPTSNNPCPENQNIGLKLQVYNTTTKEYEDILTNRTNWNDDTGERTGNIFYPSFNNTYLQKLSINLNDKKFYPSNIDPYTTASKIKLTYRIIPYNKYGVAGLLSNGTKPNNPFSISADLEVAPVMIESPCFNTSSIHPAKNTISIPNISGQEETITCRTYWNGISSNNGTIYQKLAGSTSTGSAITNLNLTKSYILFDFYPAYDVHNGYYDDGVYTLPYNNNKQLMTNASDSVTYKLIKLIRSYDTKNQLIWNKKEYDLKKVTSTGNYDAGYISATDQENNCVKYIGFLKADLENSDIDELIRIAIIPKSTKGKTGKIVSYATQSQQEQNKLLVTEEPPEYPTKQIGLYHIARSVYPNFSINSIKRQDLTAEKIKGTINYLLFDTGFSKRFFGNEYLNGQQMNSIVANKDNVYFKIRYYCTTLNQNKNNAYSTTITTNIPHGTSSGLSKNIIYNPPNDETLDIRRGYNFVIDMSISFPVYRASLQPDEMFITVYETEAVANEDEYYLSPEYASFAIRQGKIGINNSFLEEQNASVTIYPNTKIDNLHWHHKYDPSSQTDADYDSRFYPNIVEIFSNGTNQMPNYNGSRMTYGNSSGQRQESCYIGFFTGSDSENPIWRGSIGFEKNGLPYVVYSNDWDNISNNDQKVKYKSRIATYNDLNNYLKLDGTSYMTGNIKYTMYGTSKIPLEIFDGTAGTGQYIKIGGGQGLIIGAGESVEVMKDHILDANQGSTSEWKQELSGERVNIIADGDRINFFVGANDYATAKDDGSIGDNSILGQIVLHRSSNPDLSNNKKGVITLRTTANGFSGHSNYDFYLGTAYDFWERGYINSIRHVLDINGNNDISIYPSSSVAWGVKFTSGSKGILPITTDIGILGDSSHHWETAYINQIMVKNVGLRIRYDDNPSIDCIKAFKYINNGGTSISIGSNQAVVIGAGESYTNLEAANNAVTDGENLCLSADDSIYFYFKANTWDNRHAIVMSKTTEGYTFYANSNDIDLGYSSKKWGTLYVNKIGNWTITDNPTMVCMEATVEAPKGRLGSNDHPLNDMYINTIDATGTIYVGNVGTISKPAGNVNTQYLRVIGGYATITNANFYVCPDTTSNTYGLGVRVAPGVSQVSLIPVSGNDNHTPLSGVGNVGTGTYYWGYVQAQNIINKSDIELKNNLVNFDEEYAYNFIKDLPIYKFRFINKEDGYYVGTTTQSMPVELVHLFDDGDGSGYNIASAIWFLYGAFKEAQRKIEVLENQIQNLTLS